jgi:hypothetical protein
MLRKESGFTAIELITVIILAIFVAGLFLVQKSEIIANDQDAMRKRDVNSIYYYLEYVYYPTHKNYPETLSASILPGLDPESLTDPSGLMVNAKNSTLAYNPLGCNQQVCSGFSVTATLAKEAPFTRTSTTN